jgi:hypothetical protein
MTKKAVGIVISPRPDAAGGVADVLYVLFDDGEVRQIFYDGEEWRWSTTGPSASCRSHREETTAIDRLERRWRDAGRRDRTQIQRAQRLLPPRRAAR